MTTCLDVTDDVLLTNKWLQSHIAIIIPIIMVMAQNTYAIDKVKVCKNRSYLHKFILSYLSLFCVGYTISVSFIEFLRKFRIYDEIFDKVATVLG